MALKGVAGRYPNMYIIVPKIDMLGPPKPSKTWANDPIAIIEYKATMTWLQIYIFFPTISK